MTKPQLPSKNDRRAGNGRELYDATSAMSEVPTAAAATAEAVREGAEEAQAVTTDLLRHWADAFFGLPIKMLAGGDVRPVLSGRAWLDGTFEAVTALLTVQRRSVDRLLESQHRFATQLADSGWTLTAAIGGAARGRAGEKEDAQR